VSDFKSFLHVWKQLDEQHRVLITGLAVIARNEQEQGRPLNEWLGWRAPSNRTDDAEKAIMRESEEDSAKG
jgi:hypothetical protein